MTTVWRALLWLLLAAWASSFAVRVAAQQTNQLQLGAGDNVRVTVFQHPDLTLETRVNEDGTIAYPLIGRIRIGGMSVAAAEQRIADALRSGKFIEQPQVSILPVLIRSSQVSVLGQVNRAGRFPLDTFNTRVSEMIAMAGGISPVGADTAIVTGERAGKPYRKEIDIAALFLHNKMEDDITVSAGDVIYVHRAPMYYVYGEIQRPGSYRVERGMTVRQALVQGGGPTTRGTERGLRLHRRDAASGKLQVLSPDLNDAIRPDDVLFVGESFF